jgi:tetratricopeptide (TPR) repeat protein
MAPVNQIEKLCQKARQAFAARDWQKAKQVYLQALGLKSDVPDVHYGLATVYFQLRELTSAAHHFKEVTRLDPLKAGAFINLGAVLNLLQQYDDAIQALRRGLQLDSTRVEGYYNLGLVYRRKGDLDLAVTAYKEALRINPRMADAHLNLANLYFDKEQYRLALAHYEQALQLRPGWDKPTEGIAQVRSLTATPEPTASVPAPQATPPPAAATPKIDLNRTVDPALHGDYLSGLHRAAEAVEGDGTLFVQILLTEVEPAIKELSSCLLYNTRTRSDLEDCINKFESAMEHMRNAQQLMHGRLTTVREKGEAFPTH